MKNRASLIIPFLLISFISTSAQQIHGGSLTGFEHLFDLGGKVRLVESNGKEMKIRLYGNHYKTKETYSSGARFRIYLTNDKPAYVYIIGAGLSSKTFPVFPKTRDQSALISFENQVLILPDGKQYVEMNKQPGKDYLCILFSKRSLNLYNLCQNIDQGSGSFMERIREILGDDLVDIQNIQYAQSEIAFSARSSDKSMVALIIETKHE